ncbi:zinc finger protein 58-like [Topomyia yanbarensis]|uniref:zinc finger protein 58-like n=1 Tax=Topomyia yanbarensis TaxID=2498891 RepID=UPI00273AF01C|nr:zinc finger protein 58-like [Topomyia yanbarensis]
MTTQGLKSCFTCFRRTENFLNITKNDTASGENVEEIFAKHFWFTRDEFLNRIVCTSCWEKIDEFHKFYCEVERFHAPDMILEVKMETSDETPTDSAMFLSEVDCIAQDDTKTSGLKAALEEIDVGGSQMFVEAVYQPEDTKSPLKSEEKHEPRDETKVKKSTKLGGGDDKGKDAKNKDGDNEDDDDDSGEEEEDDSDLDADYKPPTKKKKVKVEQSESEPERDVRAARGGATKRPRQKKPTEGNDNFTCHKCIVAGTDKGETFSTFYKLKQHFQQMHDSPCYLFCCDKQWTSSRSYKMHISFHSGNPRTKSNKRRCIECCRWFKDEGSFADHMALVHTPEEEKRFKCDRCPKAFTGEDQLNSHIKWHDEVEQRNHHCALCNRYFLNIGNLHNHNQSHHGSKPLAGEADDKDESEPESSEKPIEEAKKSNKKGSDFLPKRERSTPEQIAEQEALIRQIVSLNCTRCEFVSDSYTKLAYHNRKFHKETGGAIHCCERRFDCRLRLYEHCLRHLNPDHFKCELCGKVFKDSQGLQHHNWWIHTPASERPYKCDICGDAFVKDYQLKQHVERHIEKERQTHTCDQCGRIYTTGLQLKKHMQRQHGALSDWVCDVCAKGFSHRVLLERHRLTHSEEGIAKLRKQCEKCGRWLSNIRNYQRHKRFCYDTSGPVKCEICGLVSVNEAALRTHNRLHHSNKPKYACSYCGKEFKKQIRCKEHEANHTGVVLYRCPYCPRMCNSSSNMYTHKKTAHPEQWAETVAAKIFKPT